MRQISLLLLVFLVIAVHGARRNSTDPALIRVGAVYTMTNESPNNHVAAYPRYADGHLGNPVLYLTGGSGTGHDFSLLGGDPLDSQDSVILSPDHSRLYVCNAGSSSVSEFFVFRRGSLRLHRVIPSGAQFPVSLELSPDGRFLFILNDDAGGSVVSVDLRRQNNETTSIALNASNSGYPLDYSQHLPDLLLSSSGNWVFVANRGDNQIISLRARNGRLITPQTPIITPIPTGIAPFSFAWHAPSTLLVAEAFGYGPFANFSGIVSFHLNLSTGALQQVTSYGITNGGGGCWIKAVGSVVYYPLTVGSFYVAATVSTRGALTPVNSVGNSIGVVWPPSSGLQIPLDFSITGDGFLYGMFQTNAAPLTWSICAFAIQANHQMSLINCVSEAPIRQGCASF